MFLYIYISTHEHIDPSGQNKARAAHINRPTIELRWHKTLAGGQRARYYRKYEFNFRGVVEQERVQVTQRARALYP